MLVLSPCHLHSHSRTQNITKHARFHTRPSSTEKPTTEKEDLPLCNLIYHLLSLFVLLPLESLTLSLSLSLSCTYLCSDTLPRFWSPKTRHYYQTPFPCCLCSLCLRQLKAHLSTLTSIHLLLSTPRCSSFDRYTSTSPMLRSCVHVCYQTYLPLLLWTLATKQYINYLQMYMIKLAIEGKRRNNISFTALFLLMCFLSLSISCILVRYLHWCYQKL